MHLLRNCTMAVLGTAIVLLGAGCGAPKPDAAAAAGEIYRMGEQGQWVDTMPRAKALALAYPTDPAAHYLLGKAYLHRAEPHLVQAEGELRTALGLFERSHAVTSITWTDAQGFQLALHRDLALVAFRWIREAMRFKLPPSEIRDKLFDARKDVEAGLALDPKDSFLKEMRATIEEYLAGPFKDLPPPTGPTPVAAAPAA